MPTPLPQRVPESAPGDFYVQAGCCLSCCLPHDEAPELLNDPNQFFKECYFRRQPRTPEEIDRAIEALCVSDIDAVRYGGTDPTILTKLRERGAAAQCDQTSEGRAWLESLSKPSPRPSAAVPLEPLAYFAPSQEESRASRSEQLVRNLHRARGVAGWLSVVAFVFLLFHLSDADTLHFPAGLAFVTCMAVTACLGLVLGVMDFREARQAPSRRD